MGNVIQPAMNNIPQWKEVGLGSEEMEKNRGKSIRGGSHHFLFPQPNQKDDWPQLMTLQNQGPGMLEVGNSRVFEWVMVLGIFGIKCGEAFVFGLGGDSFLRYQPTNQSSV